MRRFLVCLAVACLPAFGVPALAADTKPPPGRVVPVPPEEAMPVLGVPVTGPDGKTVGRLVDVLVNEDGAPQAGVIDVGGFLGVGARKIAVHWSALHFDPPDHDQPIKLALTLDQIKAAPEYGNPAKPAPVVVPARPSEPMPAVTPARAVAGSVPYGSPPAGGASAAQAHPGSAPTSNSGGGAPAVATAAAPGSVAPGPPEPASAAAPANPPAPGSDATRPSTSIPAQPGPAAQASAPPAGNPVAGPGPLGATR